MEFVRVFLNTLVQELVPVSAYAKDKVLVLKVTEFDKQKLRRRKFRRNLLLGIEICFYTSSLLIKLKHEIKIDQIFSIISYMHNSMHLKLDLFER